MVFPNSSSLQNPKINYFRNIKMIDNLILYLYDFWNSQMSFIEFSTRRFWICFDCKIELFFSRKTENFPTAKRTPNFAHIKHIFTLFIFSAYISLNGNEEIWKFEEWTLETISRFLMLISRIWLRIWQRGEHFISPIGSERRKKVFHIDFSSFQKNIA